MTIIDSSTFLQKVTTAMHENDLDLARTNAIFAFLQVV